MSSETEVRRAIQLFEYLKRVQQLKSPPVRDLETYRNQGHVIWFHSLPDHEAVRDLRTTGAADEAPSEPGPVLAVSRLPFEQPPEVLESVLPWVDGAIDDPEQEPSLREEILAEVEAASGRAAKGVGPWADGAFPVRRLADEPDVASAFDRWLVRWREWASREVLNQGPRNLYRDLFDLYTQSTSRSEELEAFIGVGTLSWAPADGEPIRRHLVTCAVEVEFDDQSGAITVSIPQDEGVSVEVEMLPPGVFGDVSRLNEIRDRFRQYEGHVLDDEQLAALVESLTHLIDADADFRMDEQPAARSGVPVVAWAPAIVMRRRTDRGIVLALEKIAADIQEAEEVPAGLVPLVDPDHQPDAGLSWDESAGAVLEVDGVPFLPLPANERQLAVIRRVDAKAQTVVQGPPGTGKTHIAAALISHLLALGKRVLVTAQTDRALVEVRDKLPEDIRSLAVSVIGNSRDDLAQLESVTRGIAQRLGEHDASREQKREVELLAKLDELSAERAVLRRRLLDLRQVEVLPREFQGYAGTLAEIAQELQSSAEEDGWLADYVNELSPDPPPVPDEHFAAWLALRRDEKLQEAEAEARGALLDLELVPPVDQFRQAVDEEKAAADRLSVLAALGEDSNDRPLAALSTEERGGLQARLRSIAADLDDCGANPRRWVQEAISEICDGLVAPWRSRSLTIAGLLLSATQHADSIGLSRSISVDGHDQEFVAHATSVLAHLEAGKSLKTQPDGTPKTGVFSAKVVKESAAFFASVRVDSRPPSEPDAVRAYLEWAAAMRDLAALDQAWPATMEIPEEDTVRERVDWHQSQHETLEGLVAIADRLVAEAANLQSRGVVAPSWSDSASVRRLADLAERVDAIEDLDRATAHVAEFASRIRPFREVAEPPAWANDLGTAVERRDLAAFGAARDRLWYLHEAQQRFEWCARFEATIERIAPELVADVLRSAGSPDWDQRFAGFGQAYRWAATEQWLNEREREDANRIARELDSVDTRIHTTVEQLSSTRAWAQALGEDRMTQSAQAYLKQYAGLTRKLGKGYSKYGAARRAEIRGALDLCRPSVPVWIMPLYRVTEQIAMAPDLFDVVIVDEASQAGLEAVFLQYLAPKMVVIGDDKQVSPTAVGLDQGKVRDLARQFLDGDDFQGSWANPTRSLFDEAQMRYGGLITLVEHRRCVPEIIGFSNRIAYEPDGIRLLPVRQHGRNRLDPIVTRFCEGGYRHGKSKVNPVEVGAIVDAVEKCCADPAYDGKTFGVIALLGDEQARAIEAQLLKRLPPEEWGARQLRCGAPPDFQGSERDVVFLSMVDAPDPDRRMGTQTRELNVQRYNVAVSRARDQVWLFHSLRADDIKNPEDMRFQLLEYCYGVAHRHKTESVPGAWNLPVDENLRVEPFDSLFEQRVFNRLVDHGYTVVPQYDCEGYRIDLVVVGGDRRFAVECDGDHWHGPDRYEADLARQIDLERGGWVFHRIRESEFYLDPTGSMAALRAQLTEYGVFPRGSEPERASAIEVETVVEEPDEAPAPSVLERGLLDEEELADEADCSPALQLVPLEPDLLLAPPEVSVVEVSPSGLLSRYLEWGGVVDRHPAEMASDLLAAKLVEAVEVEGPVIGIRLYRIVNKAAGNALVTKNVRSLMNRALAEAERDGRVVVDRPLGEIGYVDATIRTREQPIARLREPGPRPLDLIPPAELAEVMAAVAAESPVAGEEQLFRAVLEVLGFTKLTQPTTERLRLVRSLVDSRP